MNAAKNGYVAEFVTGYLQREIRKELKVSGGTDAGLRDGALGFATGRLVKISGDTLVPALFSDSNIYIVAQSDDTIREVPSDYNYQERYSNLPNLVLKNSDEVKTVALYKIVNKDDVKLIKISEPVNMIAGTQGVTGVNTKVSSINIIQTGVNSYKVLGTALYTSTPLVSGNPAGNYIYFKMVNELITTAAQFNAALSGVADDTVVYKRVNGIDENTETKTAIASEIGTNGGIEVEVCVNNTKTLKIDVMWEKDIFTHYTFDLSELNLEANV